MNIKATYYFLFSVFIFCSPVNAAIPVENECYFGDGDLHFSLPFKVSIDDKPIESTQYFSVMCKKETAECSGAKLRTDVDTVSGTTLGPMIGATVLSWEKNIITISWGSGHLFIIDIKKREVELKQTFLNADRTGYAKTLCDSSDLSENLILRQIRNLKKIFN